MLSKKVYEESIIQTIRIENGFMLKFLYIRRWTPFINSKVNVIPHLWFIPFKKPQLLKNSAAYPEACFTWP